jgi:hypothetical protein
MTETTGPGAHAKLGPSSAHRWMVCAGSIAAEAGLPDEETIHSQEGTAAHALAEMAFQRNRPCEAWLGDTVEGIVVTHEMAEYAQVYVDALRDYAEGAEIVEIESRLDLAPLRPPAPMHGTCDAWFYYPGVKRLRVVDLKYGKGVVVEVEGNKQTRYYALMAWVKLMMLSKAKASQLEEIEVVIVQPRAYHADGPIRSEILTLKELKEFGKELLKAAHAAMAPNAPRTPGDHCRWCKAKLMCPELRSKALAVAQVEFADVAEGETTPPDPMALTPAQLGHILEAADVLEAWLKVVRQRAMGELLAGRVVPGFALKNKRAIRKWHDEKAVLAWARKLKIKKDDLMEPGSLKSPAQVEKMVKKLGEVLPEELVVRASSGVTMCADTDPAALIPEAVFELIDPGTYSTEEES